MTQTQRILLFAFAAIACGLILFSIRLDKSMKESEREAKFWKELASELQDSLSKKDTARGISFAPWQDASEPSHLPIAIYDSGRKAFIPKARVISLFSVDENGDTTYGTPWPKLRGTVKSVFMPYIIDTSGTTVQHRPKPANARTATWPETKHWLFRDTLTQESVDNSKKKQPFKVCQ